jgi:hypothetical protein
VLSVIIDCYRYFILVVVTVIVEEGWGTLY